MHFDDDGDFWHDEPTQRLRRVDHTPVRGSRHHTGAVPIVPFDDRSQAFRRPTWRTANGRIEPSWARLGMVAAAFALLLSLALVVRGAGEGDGASRTTSSAAADARAPITPDVAATPAPSLTPVGGAPAVAPVPTVAAVPVPPTAAAVEGTASRSGQPDGAVAAPVTIPIKVSCSNSYKVAAGDYWLGIAAKTGSGLKALLAANDATVRTVLYPGRPVCLPAGASAPAAVATATTAAPPAASTAAPTTAAPASAASTAAPTTAAPTTATPTTRAPSPTPQAAATPAGTIAPVAPVSPAAYTRQQVEQIIRDVFPDDQEDKAIAVATRESTLRPGVRNYCCYGLFQIYFGVHKSWLAGMGITSAEMLYDPVLNANAAYALYQRSGGWGPWGG